MAEIITIICKRTVVSTKPVQAGKSYPLSVLDRHMEHNHVRMVLYYPSMGAPTEPGEITGRLRESLAVTLTHFPIVTGRLQKNDEDQWMIKCNDAGVRMLEAKAKGSLEEWLRNVDRDKELMLVYWEEMYHKPYFWSTFYVQITEFEDGGLAIGLSCTHLLADPTCATMFIKAWADTTFPGKMMSPSFFYPLPLRSPGNTRPNHKPYNSLINHYKASINKSIDLVDKKHTTVSFGFSDDMVRVCMEMAQPNGANDKSSPSPFEALAGLFWVCISKVKGVKNGLIDMSIFMDVRKVLGLDKGFFGNSMVYNKVHLESSQENSLSQAATSIGEVVAKMDNEGIMDLIEWLQCNDDQTPSLMNSCDLICASLEAVDPFSAIFEDGIAPIHVSCHIEPVLGLGKVLILPAKPSEGQLSRVVMVTLPRDEVIKLCEDGLILQLSPTLLMDFNKT
ncbi:protein ECERIFERUM 26-like [Prunus yedoensis var. nudiflora]|uniref:Protein ECERIFERUM 26-like n=1 Tax=Prunus yedoensis var. nudiflora TaxID=2094558 RepID=A0A314XGU7_PRUYE|nr:protein ECERIFERUM 26-like [Prunus yedoensis var. nudiflora]